MKGEVETSSDNAEKQLQQQRTMMISKNLGKLEVKILIVHNIPNTGLSDVEQAISVYMEFEDDCIDDEFPITTMKDLYATKSYIPAIHTESATTIASISQLIHQQLLNIIPTTNIEMVDMISPFKQSHTGYKALWTIMQQTCPFMRPTPEGGGPIWTKCKCIYSVEPSYLRCLGV